MGNDPDPSALANAFANMQAVPIDTYKAVMTCLITFKRRKSVQDHAMPCCLLAGRDDTNASATTHGEISD